MRTRISVLFVLAWLASAPAFAAITNDTASNGSTCASCTSITQAYTVGGACADPALVVVVGWQGGATLTGGVTYNGNAMSAMWNFRDTIFATQGIGGWVLTGSGLGAGSAHNIVATFGFTASVAAVVASSWCGVDQASPARTAVTEPNMDANLTGSVVCSNATSGDVVVDGVHAGYGTYGTSTQTHRAHQDELGNFDSVGHSSASATGSTTMGYTYPEEVVGALACAALKPSAGGATVTPKLTVIGVGP